MVLADDETIAGRSFANLPNAHTTSFGQLSAHDVLRNDWILFSDRTLPGSAGAPAVAEAAAPSRRRGGCGRCRLDGADRQRHGDAETEADAATETEEATTDA